MNQRKTDKYRYYISHLLEDFPVGTKFRPFALHITILPWFALETQEAPFIEWFYKKFGNIQAFDTVAERRDMFGPRKDVPVSILSPKDKFMELHLDALSWFGEVGARWAERDPYVGDDFVPHVAQRNGFVLEEGEKLHIGSLTLFKAHRQEDQIRIVVARAGFDESR